MDDQCGMALMGRMVNFGTIRPPGAGPTAGAGKVAERTSLTHYRWGVNEPLHDWYPYKGVKREGE